MPMLRPAEIATVLERAQISHAIVDSRYIGDFRAAAEQAGTVRSLIRYDGDHGRGELETRLRSVAPGFTPVDTGRDDPALIAFTSGTTGKPKGCVHYHRDVLAPADSFARHVLKPQPGGRWACSAPIAFTFGLGMLLIFPWRFGGAAVTIEQPGPKPLLEAIARFEVTTLATAPTAYKAMLALLEGHDISSLRTCVSAGEHLPAPPPRPGTIAPASGSSTASARPR
jgi:2-aminobenzoate-CoA ligase